MQDLSNYRKVYEKSELLETNIPNNPIELFSQWFTAIEASGAIDEVNAMTVSTIGLDGAPKNRVVLLKQFDNNGFVFFTNYDSDKGKSMLANPNVCLSFFWHLHERQVIIKGKACKTSTEVSDNYFNSRPAGSQLGALVSNQSQEIPNRAFLEDVLKNLEQEYQNKPIKRPENWGGFLVTPSEIEFWQGRPNRLHDRVCYYLQDDFSWKIKRLSP